MDNTRESLKTTIDIYENNSSRMGKLLYEIKKEKKYKEWGYKTFEEYIRSDLGMDLRRAYYHISIWGVFGVTFNLTEKEINELGWTKAGLLVTLVKCGEISKSNINNWISEAKKLTTKKLTEEVKRIKEDLAKTGKYKTSDVPTTTFMEMEPTFDGTLHRIVLSLFPGQHENYQRALRIASKIANSNKQGHLLDLICLYYLSGNTNKSVDEAYQLNWFMKQLENAFKVKLVAFRTKEDLKFNLERMLENLNDI